MMKKIISLSILSFLSNFSYSLGTLDPRLDSIVEREYNSRIAQPEMSHREIKQGVYLIKCNTVCGNSLLVYGKDGGILINSMLAKTLPWLRKEIRDISGINNIKILITTNAHFWNSNANGLFGGMMDFMISHKNTRKRILSNSVIEDLQILPGYSQERHVDNAGARVTFLDEMELNFNQEKVDLIHLKGASTDGDILIFFKKKKKFWIFFCEPNEIKSKKISINNILETKKLEDSSNESDNSGEKSSTPKVVLDKELEEKLDSDLGETSDDKNVEAVQKLTGVLNKTTQYDNGDGEAVSYTHLTLPTKA